MLLPRVFSDALILLFEVQSVFEIGCTGKIFGEMSLSYFTEMAHRRYISRFGEILRVIVTVCKPRREHFGWFQKRLSVDVEMVNLSY